MPFQKGNLIRKGIRHTQETKQKIRDSLKGNVPWNKGKINIYSEETKRKISNAAKGNSIWKGRKHIKESKEKISKSKKGNALSKDHKNNIVISMIKNKKKKYCDAFYDKEYKDDLRKQYCEHCGISRNLSFKLWDRNLCLHHDNGNYNCAPDELLTLCLSCHVKLHWALRKNKKRNI